MPGTLPAALSAVATSTVNAKNSANSAMDTISTLLLGLIIKYSFDCREWFSYGKLRFYGCRFIPAVCVLLFSRFVGNAD